MRFNIISVDEFGLTKLELAGILKGLNVSISSANNEVDVKSLLNDPKHETHAVIWAFNSIESDCFSAIKRLKGSSVCKNIPIMIISHFTDKKYIIKAIESGAVEYIAKPFDNDIILKKTCKILGISYENAKLQAYDDDIVTFNFPEMFNREIKAASRGSHDLTVLLAAVAGPDGEKASTKDTEPLIEVFNRTLKTKLRETDTCFRYGTDSLIILLPFANKPGAAVVENKIHQCFDSHSVIKQKNSGFKLITTSVTFPEDGKVRDKLLEKLENNYMHLTT